MYFARFAPDKTSTGAPQARASATIAGGASLSAQFKTASNDGSTERRRRTVFVREDSSACTRG